MPARRHGPPSMPEPRSGPPRRPVLCTLAVLGATAGVVALARGGEAFWICVPAALLLSTWARTLPGVLLTSAAAVGVAAAPALASGHVRPEPSVPPAVLIPAASVVVLQLVRKRADRESLDGFKLLNDRFGHPTGDDLLRDVAAAIRLAVRDQDTVARLGGDEFCVLAPETDDHATRRLAARATDAVQRAATGVDTLGACRRGAVSR